MKKGCVWVFFTYIDENLMMYSDYQAKINMSTQELTKKDLLLEDFFCNMHCQN